MASVTFAIDKESKSQLSKFLWINLSELVKQELLRRQELLERFNSKEEQELIKWSVELGRKAKKESFKEFLAKMPKERREKLLSIISPEKRKEYE